MLKVISLTVGQLQTNCYIVYDEQILDNQNQCIVIDPGDDGQYITTTLLDKNLNPKAVIATHGHFDHVLAAMELKLIFKIPFIMKKEDQFLLARQKDTAEYFLGVKADPPASVDIDPVDGGEIEVGKTALKIIETPGHTPGSICLAHDEEKMLFVGDLLFADRRQGEATHKYSNPFKLRVSIAKIKKNFKGYTVYPGHGDIFTL